MSETKSPIQVLLAKSKNKIIAGNVVSNLSTLVDELDKYIKNLSSDKIVIFVIIQREQRKKFHMYFPSTYPSLKHTSFQSQSHDKERLHTFYKCYECGNRRVCIDDYHYGYMDNNKDEYRTGKCRKCGHHVTFEMNYDDWDNVRIIYKNNAIAMGHYLNYISKPSYAESGIVSIDEIEKILKCMPIYEIETPAHNMKHKALESYIDKQIEKLQR